MVKVREDMTGWKMWEHGVPDSRLTIIKQVEDYIEASGAHKAAYLCICNCGNNNYRIARASDIKTGKTKSCGCLHIEQNIITSQQNKKYNKYELTGEYGIGYCYNDNTIFYFDIEDYDKIKDYSWAHNNRGYVSATLFKNKRVLMHRLILNNKFEIIDHINKNRTDNRKCNLRGCTKSQNGANSNVPKNNISGFIGVSFVKKTNKWCARITVDYKDMHLGTFNNKEDAIRARLKAEKEYFGEFAPQRHLFKQYKINETEELT